jgi:hypothetical protein
VSALDRGEVLLALSGVPQSLSEIGRQADVRGSKAHLGALVSDGLAVVEDGGWLLTAPGRAAYRLLEAELERREFRVDLPGESEGRS